MLKVISGRFHPTLERAFVERISEFKRDPLAPLLVVAPSSRLIERLQMLLSKSATPTLNVHFHSISSITDDVVASEGALTKPVLSDPLFFDTLIKNILKEGRSFPEMEGIAIPKGFPPAVRSTLRDLLDAGINEDNVEEAIREEFVGKEVDLGSLRSLLNLYRSYLKKIRQLPVAPRSEVLIRAAELAPSSTYLSRFDEVLFYGFYDMTGLQFNFFRSSCQEPPHDDVFSLCARRPRLRFFQTISGHVHPDDPSHGRPT
jgi:hypothetical protein